MADGLLLRPAVRADRDGLIALQGAVHAGQDGTHNAGVAAWARDLFDRAHPTVATEDITVVEDRSTAALVSSLTLVRQRWCYGGIPFGVGRIELVATHPDYRGQGLIGRQFEVLHRLSTRRGDLMQAITDLMYYHGEFGYQPVLTQRAGRGGKVADLAQPADQTDIVLRPARHDDIPMLVDIDRHANDRSLLSCPRDAALWEHELNGHDVHSMVHDDVFVVQRANEPIGYLLIGYGGIPSFSVPDWLPGLPCPESAVSISGFELLPGVSWWSVAASVVRAAAGTAEGFLLWLGADHPAYHSLIGALTRRPPDIGWFLRVPDLAGFLRRITPVLEARLADSVAQAMSADLRIHLYTQGVELRLRDGRIVAVEPWLEHSRRAADVSLPEQMFLQLLLGHADLAEIARAFPDHRLQNDIGRLLLTTLFRKHPSHIWPLI